MRRKILIVIIFLILIVAILIGFFKIKHIYNTPYAQIKNYTITNIEVQENRVHLEGRLHSTLIIVSDYVYRIDDDAFYIKVYLNSAKRSKGTVEKTNSTTMYDDEEAKKHLSIYVDEVLQDGIEKIFVEDDEHAIKVWDKSQGYGEFDIEEMWKNETQKLN